MKHVILGNGAAGISAAEKLRQLDEGCDITVISIEDTPVYTKFMLPDYIGGKVSKERLILRNLNYYEQNRINLLLEQRIENIESKKKYVRLINGDPIEYDRLLVAVGGSPVVPNIKGLKDIEFFTINSIKDADNIKINAVEGEKAVIVGAGLTGIEMAFALKRIGMDVTLVEREARILPQQLDSVSAEILLELIRKEGIELLLESNIQKISKENGCHVETLNGEKLNFHMLVITIGTRPNLDVINGTEIKTNRGILVNDYLETSAEDIFAAGDVAEIQNNSSSGLVSSYIWPNALAQGKCAAYNMVGEPREFSCDAGFNNVVRLRDLPLVSMGMINPVDDSYESLVYCDKNLQTYKKVVVKDNMIKGMIFIGDMASANAVGDIVRKGRDISDIRDFILEKDFAGKFRAMT